MPLASYRGICVNERTEHYLYLESVEALSFKYFAVLKVFSSSSLLELFYMHGLSINSLLVRKRRTIILDFKII